MKKKSISITTSKQTQFINIDSLIEKEVKESGVKEGLCTIFIPHTTAGITINENADPDVVKDIQKQINKIIPFHDRYSHMEGNSAAHIKSTLFGPSLTIIIDNGSLVYGTWQSVYFCEFDGPRTRKIIIKIIAG